ncbi:sodium:proton symporter [Pseudovibrio sp. SPO723]|uniref:sodium:proton symporter n=1 Tax=Nesiotobacter zosterae TaxID=392721 RepID=UPI0029C350B4|nr:sodium:proton symporter [Pseudovibrio sp. SPO723]MDX5594665.1 sodium:proton symporter [Pseudovibrio sp. SPO723]
MTSLSGPRALAELPLKALALLGHYGTYTVAISLLLGILLPHLASTFRPFLTTAIFILIFLNLLRVDTTALQARLRRPKLLIAAGVWMMIVWPLICAAGALAIDLEALAPGAMTALFIATAAPPVMSAPAFIYMLRLDGAFSLALSVVTLLIAPLSSAMIAALILPATLKVDPFAFALNMFFMLAAAIALAALCRKVIGTARIAASANHLNGLNCIVLFVFAVAAMDGVAHLLLTDPAVPLVFTLITFGATLLQMGVTALMFLRSGGSDAFVIAHSVGARNLGLMLASLGGSIPEFAWLYFSLGQLPIFLMPLFLSPLARRLRPVGNLR